MKLMKKIPGGSLLIPMLLAALINTFFPRAFQIGGFTQAFFTKDGLLFVLGAALFLSGCLLKISTLGKVLKRYSLILVLRLVINTLVSLAFYKLFGLKGFLGISTLAFIVSLTSLNPAVFLAFSKDFGDEIDLSAFGFVAIIETPIISMLIYNFTNPHAINFTPILSTLIPIIIGVIITNIDDELGKFLAGGMPFMIFMLGWGVGININIVTALSVGLSGILMTVLYYIFSFLPIYIFEKFILRKKGFAAASLAVMAGVSASFPIIMASTHPELQEYTQNAAAIVSFGVVITALISPYLVKYVMKDK